MNGPKREPDLIIGSKENPYLLRWYLTPWSKYFRYDENGKYIPFQTLSLWKKIVRSLPNVYLHRILRDDDDRALHDHPWWSLSFLLSGAIREIEWTKSGYEDGHWFYSTLVTHTRNIHHFLQVRLRRAKHTHRLELVSKEAWTLFITGPKIREWCFHCPQGLVHWKLFTTDDGTGIGRGCGE